MNYATHPFYAMHGVGDPQIRAWYYGPKEDFVLRMASPWYGPKEDFTLRTAGAVGMFNGGISNARSVTGIYVGDYGDEWSGGTGAYRLQAYTNQNGWHEILGQGVDFHYLCTTLKHLATNSLWGATPLRIYAGDQLLAGGHYFNAARWTQMLCQPVSARFAGVSSTVYAGALEASAKTQLPQPARQAARDRDSDIAYYIQAWTGQDGWHAIAPPQTDFASVLCPISRNPLWDSTPIRIFQGSTLLPNAGQTAKALVAIYGIGCPRISYLAD